MKKGDKKDNVIDLTERISSPDPYQRLKNLKVRFDLERTKVAVSTSLLSIVVIVTLANNNLMSKVETEPVIGSRSIASVPTGTSAEEDRLVERLAKTDLSMMASIGRKPSALEKLALGELEGKYAVQLQDGKLRELAFSDTTAQGDQPKHIEDRSAFLEMHRDLLPVDFDKSVKVETAKGDGGTVETYQLVNEVSMPMAKVEFQMDSGGRMLGMRVSRLSVVSK